MLAQADDKRLSTGIPRQHAGQRRDKQPRKPRGHVIHHVIEPCTAPAELEVARRLVADHRIHGAHDFEQHERRQAAEHVPEQRARKAVGQVLAQAFNGGAAACGGIHPLGIAAYELADRGPRRRQVVTTECALDPPHVPDQIAEREQAVHDEGVQQPSERIGERSRRQHDRRDPTDPDDGEQHEQRDTAAVPVDAPTPQHVFHAGQRAPEQPDRMPAIRGVADSQIGKDRDTQRDRMSGEQRG